ncbi:MAG TPA: Calx-beta domain-containing protein [Gaiellaceae bacterium]|nr:Calx-beta domain-containing protein [Gaiellaceae bacterium]
MKPATTMVWFLVVACGVLAVVAGALGAAAPIRSAASLGPGVPDEPPVRISVNDASVTEGDSGTVAATFTVSLSRAHTLPVTVDYATANETATAPVDYVAAAGQLSFAPGVTSLPVTVLVNGDSTDEAVERFFVNLSNPTNADIQDGQGFGVINDDDGPALSIADVAVTEGNSGPVTATFVLSLSAASPQAVSVQYATANGSAISPSDYVAATGIVSFTAGQTTRSVAVTVNGDVLDESNETFFVNLSGAVNGTIADAQGVGTINDDDGQPSLSVNDVGVTEGNSGSVNATFTVTLAPASGQTVTLDYATADDTATAGADYQSTSGQLSFVAGQTARTVTVPVFGDAIDETHERFTVALSNAANATIADGQGVGTINDDDGPTVSIGDIAVAEGNSGTATASFLVSLSAPSPQTVGVSYATANGTATAPADYVAAAGTLTFAPGETAKPVAVGVNGDVFDELDEAFFVNLSAPVNGTVGDGQGVGTITDDDAEPALSVNDLTVTEGNSGTTNATFVVTLSAASGRSVTVDYATSDGTATAPADYAARTGQVTFAPGEATRAVTVPVNGDLLDEADETFTVELSGPVNATISDALGLATITDDDALPALSVGNATVGEGNSGTTTATFTVTLSAASGRAVSVGFATADDTAEAPGDYQTATGTLGFAAGQTARTVTVVVNGDTSIEGNETFLLLLSAPANATIADGEGVGTIVDDELAPTLSIGDAAVTEGSSGTVNATFTVALASASEQTVTVGFATADGTATAPADYAAATSQLSFAPGETTRTITVVVNGDALDESNETFLVDLSGAVNATIADGQGIGTITDDDAPPTLSIDDVTVPEGSSGSTSATFTVRLNTASGQSLSVDYATADGSATAGSDYTAGNGTVAFVPGQTSRQVTVPIVPDALDENDETFNVNLTNAVNATIADGQAVGRITDDDPLPTLSIEDKVVTEGNSGTLNATFTVSLDTASGRSLTVNYATADGTATATADYQTRTGTLTFAPGQTTRPVTVPIVGDTLDENNETFTVNLSGAVNATIGDAQGIATIIDDDGEPALTVHDAAVTEGNAGSVDAVFTVTLAPSSGQTVTVDYATANGTATAGGDYQARSGRLTFAGGVTTREVVVPVSGDVLDEVDETFTVTLSNAVNAVLADAQGIGTIVDDDQPPAASIGDVSVAEGNSATTTATFTVVLSAPSGRTVTIDGATADVTAHAPSDYLAVPATPVSFAPGQTSRTIAVVVNGDIVVEPDETFAVNLANANGATIADAQALGTISNDDAPAPPPPPPPPPPLPPPPPPPPPPSRPPARTRAALYLPPAGARVTKPPLLAWRAVPRARFYNVQLFRKGRKILSVWPYRPRLRLKATWTYRGRTMSLRAGSYTWIVWPAFGRLEQPRYGGKLGASTFRIVKARG